MTPTSRSIIASFSGSVTTSRLGIRLRTGSPSGPGVTRRSSRSRSTGAGRGDTARRPARPTGPPRRGSRRRRGNRPRSGSGPRGAARSPAARATAAAARRAGRPPRCTSRSTRPAPHEPASRAGSFDRGPQLALAHAGQQVQAVARPRRRTRGATETSTSWSARNATISGADRRVLDQGGQEALRARRRPGTARTPPRTGRPRAAAAVRRRRAEHRERGDRVHAGRHHDDVAPVAPQRGHDARPDHATTCRSRTARPPPARQSR